MGGYIGIDNQAKPIINMYIGIDGRAARVKKAYIGVDNKAKMWFSSESKSYTQINDEKVNKITDNSNKA